MSVFWEQTKDILYKRNISQAEMSRLLKIHKTRFHRWYNEDIIPPADYALQIANILNIDINFLITGEKQPEINEISTMLKKSPEILKIVDLIKYLDEEDLKKIRAAVEICVALGRKAPDQNSHENAG